MQFEVLMSCYEHDDPQFLREAIVSAYDNQTRKPDSFRIMVDGPINENLNAVLTEYETKYPGTFAVTRLPENKGLGNALGEGVALSEFDCILRMDSDDICAPDRFEKQLHYAETHPECDVVGTFTAEFFGTPDNVLSVRTLKCTQEEIEKQARSRSPVSHVSVLLRRSAVIKAGNYQHFPLYEDYYLWIRMLRQGSKFANFPEVLVFVRTDENRYQRKGSRAYIESTSKFQKYLLEIGFISRSEYLRNRYGRLLVARMPVGCRKLVYEKLLRKRPEDAVHG